MWDLQEQTPFWVEVDLDAIASNVAAVRGFLRADNKAKLMAVVKSNAYGHGLLRVAQTALANGADSLGVTHPGEGVALREGGIDAPVLVFRPLFPGEEEEVVRHGLTASVSTLKQAERLSVEAQRLCVKTPVHLKLETGMGRTGFLRETLLEEADHLFSLPGLAWEGIYTHFASASTDPVFTRRQFQIFSEIVDSLRARGIEFPLQHVCNSAATLLYPEMHLDLVRVGTLLYGQFPAGVKENSLELIDTWSCWTRVLHIFEAKPGMTIGYGRTHRVRDETTIALLPIGYRDGFGLDVQRRPAGLLDLCKVIIKLVMGYLGHPLGSPSVSINGHPALVVGRVGMELSCVDVGNIADIGVGTPVLLQIRRTSVKDTDVYIYRQREPISQDE